MPRSLRTTGRPAKADDYYLEARDAVLEAVRGLDRKCRKFRTGDGVGLSVNRKMPLRILLLGINRKTPGEDGYTAFTFQRDGRVGLGGNRKVPLREAMAAGHEPWASRQELMELAAQLRSASPCPLREGTSDA